MATAPAVAVNPSTLAPARREATRRSQAASRRSPATVINYAYLRRDILYVSVLAPVMVLLLMAAFVFLGR